MKKRNSLYDVWKNDLPGSFDKNEARKVLSERWGISERNVIKRIQGRYFEAVKEANYIAKTIGICFDDEGKFFFDEKTYEKWREKEQLNFASSVGLSE